MIRLADFRSLRDYRTPQWATPLLAMWGMFSADRGPDLATVAILAQGSREPKQKRIGDCGRSRARHRRCVKDHYIRAPEPALLYEEPRGVALRGEN